MSADSQRSIAPYIAAKMRDFKLANETDGRRPLVTIARNHGAGGEEIGRALAELLGVSYFDREIIERIAKAAKTDPAMLAALDEGVRDQLQVWLASLIPGRKYSPSEYVHGLVRVVLAIAPLGGVLIGRGANIVLHRHRVFRVRIVGTPEVCARRLAAASGQSLHDAAHQIRQINQERGQFIWETFKVRSNDPINYDIVVNTDHFPDFGRVAHFLAAAYHAHDDSGTRAERAAEPMAAPRAGLSAHA